MRALITGAGGQLGRALQRTAPSGISVHVATHKELDIADRRAVQSTVSHLRPDIILNAAGFTNVDMAEEYPEEARRANHLGPKVLAQVCADRETWLVHVSTSYVFDGAQSWPYATSARTNPLNLYGITKLEGELAVTAALPGRSSIVRTSWLHSINGRHFLARMLHLLETKPVVRVVCDQYGTPTSADGLAATLWALALGRAAGIFHWSDSGTASWYEFALAIAEDGRATGTLGSVSRIVPVSSAAYDARALRPPYTLLDNSATESSLGIVAPPWRASLTHTLLAIASERCPPHRARSRRQGITVAAINRASGSTF